MNEENKEVEAAEEPKTICYMHEVKIDHIEDPFDIEEPFDPKKHHICLVCGSKLMSIVEKGEGTFKVGSVEITTLDEKEGIIRYLFKEARQSIKK